MQPAKADEVVNDAAWLLGEHRFWEVSDAVESTVYRETDILGELESRISCQHQRFTVERRSMTGEQFERLNENGDEDDEDCRARMEDLNARLTRIREQQAQDQLPKLPGFIEEDRV